MVLHLARVFFGIRQDFARLREKRDARVNLLAQCRDPMVMDLLTQYWQEPVRSMDSRRAVILSLGASSLPESAAFLLTVVADESPALAADAIAALASSRFRNDVAKRLDTVVASRSEPEVRSAFEHSFNRPP